MDEIQIIPDNCPPNELWQVRIHIVQDAFEENSFGE
jgi:hypothetical protein